MGSLWNVAHHCGSLWDRCGIVAGSLWLVVGHCGIVAGSLWLVVGRCGSFRVLVTTGTSLDNIV